LRKRKAPGFNWYYLHATALNTAWIIQAIHDKGYVLDDIKPQNILVSDRALVAVIDTDSFQVRDSQTGKVYRCTVGSEGFTPVELLGKDFSTTDQTEICDRFRLAVLIHYLLFGYDPFSGQWIGLGESPEQTEMSRKGFWYGGQNSLIHPSQNTISLDIVHPEIKRCFLKCFNDGYTSPHLRPTAEDWHNALEIAVNELTVCSKIDSHHYSRSYGKCYWCERSAKLRVDIFPGGSGTATVPTATKNYKLFAVDKTLDLVSQKGQKITVIAQVFSTIHDSKNKNVFFINFANTKNSIDDYSSFTVFILSLGLQDLYKVKGLKVDDLHGWVGQYIQITGVLEIHQNVPQIFIKEASQLKPLTKDEANKLLKLVSSQASSTAVKTTTTPLTVIQIPSSTPSNQASKSTILQPLSNSPPTTPPYQQLPPNTNTGLSDWQKAVITGSVIGTFLLIGMLLTRQQPLPSQSLLQQSVAQQNISSAPETSSSVESSHESVEESTASSDSTPKPISTQAPAQNSDSPPQPSISQQEAVNLISKWLEYKRRIFAPPYDRSLGDEILTSKAYNDKIHRADGQESSLEWLANRRAYYTYGVQSVDCVNYFAASGDRATIDVVITERRTLYNSHGRIDRSSSVFDTSLVRYNLQSDNGRWKIAELNTVKTISRR
jgi:serine/threonine protein kinase